MHPLSLSAPDTPSQLYAVKLVYRRRHRDQRRGRGAQQRATPPKPQPPVHGWAGQRQQRAKQTPQHYQRRNGRGRKRWEHVNEVRLDGSEYPHHADFEQQQPDDGHGTVHVLVRRPSVLKEKDRNQDAEEDADWEAHLRLVDIIVGLGEADDGHVVRPCHKQDAGDRNAKVG